MTEKYRAKRMDTGEWLGDNPAFGSTAVVVGNVWDNPEMLEVQT